jgi:hypothetical protein
MLVWMKASWQGSLRWSHGDKIHRQHKNNLENWWDGNTDGDLGVGLWFKQVDDTGSVLSDTLFSVVAFGFHCYTSYQI